MLLRDSNVLKSHISTWSGLSNKIYASHFLAESKSSESQALLKYAQLGPNPGNLKGVEFPGTTLQYTWKKKKKIKKILPPWIKAKSRTFLIRTIGVYIKPKNDGKCGVGSSGKSSLVWKSRVFTLPSVYTGWDHFYFFFNCSDPAALKHIKFPLQSMGAVHT